MTVPRAIELIGEIAPTLPRGLRARRRHGRRSGDGARRRSAPARASSSSPVFRPAVIERVPRAEGAAAMPGCFSPTEILAAWDAGADVVKVFPATALGPVVLQGPARPVAAGAADADRRREPRKRRRLDPGGRGRHRRRAARWSIPKLVAAGNFDGITERARRFVERVRQRAGGVRMSRAVKCVTFGEIMLRLSPPGFERLFQSPVLQATFGGGEANVAVSLAQFGFDSYYVTRVPANPIGDAAVRALRAEGVRTRLRAARRRAPRHLLRRDRREPARVDAWSTTGRARRSPTVKPGEIPWGDVLDGRGVVPRDRASRRRSGPAVADATREALDAARAAGARDQHRPQLPARSSGAPTVRAR